MLVVVLISMFAIKFFPELVWLNKKPETLSVLFGYNNWWQISAGQSYFARVTNSPFTHMWYIAMLLQVELVLPWIYQGYVICKKKNKSLLFMIPFIIITVLSMGIIPLLQKNQAPEMRIYFGTDARIFSILLGMCLGFWHDRKKTLSFLPLRNPYVSEVVFALLVGVLGGMFLIISPESKIYTYSFILASLLTLLIISICANRTYPLFDHLKNPVTKLLSSFSYEVYLTHYPIMFMMLLAEKFDNKLLYILLVLGSSILIHFALSISFTKKQGKYNWVNVLKLAVLIPVVLISSFGGIEVLLAKDHTKEMQELEKLLEENESIQKQMQEEYLEKRKQMQDLMNDPAAMAEDVGAASLPVTGIGDSVMLGALPSLYETFENGDFDAQQNRSYYPLYDIVESRSKDGTLGNPVVIAIGTNGPVPISWGREIVEMCGDRYVYWLTITNDWQFNSNEAIYQLGEEYDNVTVLDWKKYSADHPEYFYSDEIHLRPAGQEGYAQFILNGIAKDLIDRKYADFDDNEVLGIGDGFLLGAMDDLKLQLTDSFTICQEDLDFNYVRTTIEQLKSSDSMPAKVFITLGNSSTISTEDLKSVFDLCVGSEVIYIKMPVMKGNNTNANVDAVSGSYDNLKIIDWSNAYKEHSNYFSPDRIHLTDKGSKALSDLIIQELNNME